ncbi:MAG TPA: hypothetical protein VFV02_11770 [Acidimicrobiales bacterium]|nr:hypothetical protein [Acidimicrobiales bacterium]
MKKQVAFLMSFAALTGAVVGGAKASAVSVAQPATVAGHAHLFLSKTALGVQRALGIGTGCLGTLSPGCAPIPLQYNGGPVEAAGSKNFLIFWEPTGSSVASNYNSTLQRFFGDVGGSSLYGIASQYYQTTSTGNQNILNLASVGGSWTDTTAYPSSTLQDSDVQAEVSKAIKANSWPTGIGDEYFVYLSKGENECMSGSCSFSTFCAYHGEFASGSSTVLYAAMPYAGTNLSGCGIQSGSGTPNGPDTDAEISIASHELMETVTDPMLNAWFDASGAEIGDKCAYTYGPTGSNGADLTVNGHPYIVQEEFDNASLGCSI